MSKLQTGYEAAQICAKPRIYLWYVNDRNSRGGRRNCDQDVMFERRITEKLINLEKNLQEAVLQSPVPNHLVNEESLRDSQNW